MSNSELDRAMLASGEFLLDSKKPFMDSGVRSTGWFLNSSGNAVLRTAAN
jgi:hypothetical protein